jgi:large subunit ribosomal protein L17
MRHQKKRNKLSRDAGHRKALIRNMCGQVLQHERVQTTEAKAKVVKPEVEKLITLAKRGDLHARRQALATLNQDKFVVHKLFEEIAPRYARWCISSWSSFRGSGGGSLKAVNWSFSLTLPLRPFADHSV